ncbi:hypothetical protein H8959_014460 [Pygathrix nigripes]
MLMLGPGHKLRSQTPRTPEKLSLRRSGPLACSEVSATPTQSRAGSSAALRDVQSHRIVRSPSRTHQPHRWISCATPGEQEERQTPGLRPEAQGSPPLGTGLIPVRASRAKPPPHRAPGPARQTVPGCPETYAARRPRGPT